LRSVGTVHDITLRKLDEEALQRLNRELRAISNCNQTLMRAEDEQALLDDICRIICDDAGYRMAWVGYSENDKAKTIRPFPGRRRGRVSRTGTAHLGGYGTRARSQRNRHPQRRECQFPGFHR